MRQNINEKGITLIALAITVIVLAMIAIPCVVGVTTVVEADVLANFRSDLNNLEESISQIYGKDADISNIGPEYVGSKTFLDYYQGEVSDSGKVTAETGKIVKNPNDDDKYYVIDANKLNNYLKNDLNIKLSTLNYGANNYKLSTEMPTSDASDVYIINNQSRTIYYTSGIEYNSGASGKSYKYYRLPEDYTKIFISKETTITKTDGTTIKITADNATNFYGQIVDYTPAEDPRWYL